MTVVSAFLAFVMVATAFPMGAAAPDATANSRIGTVSIGGITWTEDIRVTRNGASDTMPQVTVDAQHDAHILWQSQRTPNGYYYVKLNRLGEFLSQETFISSHILAGWGDAYPLGPTVDIDSSNNLHVVFDNGWTDVKYMKFDEQGNVLVAERQVGPADSTASHTPTVAVATDDTVHIAHEEYRFQCEDIAYDKLSNDNQDIWIDRVVSSDVASHCEFSLIKADKFSGGMLFTFGSATGTWLARFDKFGTKNMASVKIRTETDLKIADVAATPNGNMHVVWSDNGHIYYTMVDKTGVKVVDAREISGPGTSNPGFPRIAATSDNRAVIVWSDARYGNKEIVYAIIASGHEADTSAPENVRLTNSNGDKTQPWIAIDQDDNFHVAWTDTRDGGNEEIYYKFAYNFALELFADPIDVAGMFFMHPNETRTLPMFVKNKGGLPDGYNVELAYEPQSADQDGWRISIDRTYIEQLGSLEITPVNLTVHAPANALEGDNVSITVNASSIAAPSEFDLLNIPVFVKVSRQLKISAGEATKIGRNGETVSFTLNLQNKGDVREDGITVQEDVGVSQDWPMTLSKTTASLDPSEVTSLTATISIPVDAQGLYPGRFQVSAFSAADSSIRSNVILTVIVQAAFVIEMTASPPQAAVNPGATAQYEITVKNVGNLASAVQIDVHSQTPTIPGWQAAVDRHTIYLSGGQFTPLTLSVTVPSNAVADTRLSLVVSATSIAYATEGQVSVMTLVNRVQDLHADTSTGAPVKVGRTVSYDLIVSNNGNGDESLALDMSKADDQKSWTFEYVDGAAPITNLFVPHGQTKTVQVRTTVGADALAGTHVSEVVMTDGLGGIHRVPLAVVVQQFYSVAITAKEFKLDGSPGGSVEYTLDVTNNGNGRDNFTLSTVDLPVDYATSFYLVEQDQAGNPTKTKIEDVLPLNARQSAQVSLVLSVPLSTTATKVEFSAHATSQAQEQDGVILVTDIKKADLKPGTHTLTPNEPSAGQITAITVEVLNSGDIDAKTVVVAFKDNGQLIAVETLVRVAAGQKGFVTFAWLPTAGEHQLEFDVDPLAGPSDLIGLVVESNEDNNVLVVNQPVGSQAGILPGFEAPAVMAGLMVVVLAAAAARRRRD